MSTQTSPASPREAANGEGINEAEIAPMFKALGDPTRLRIFQFLRSCTCCSVVVGEDGAVRPVEGPTVGAVCCHITGTERITSTISEHLKELRAAGLIVTEKRGRYVVCSVSPSLLPLLAAFFSPADEKGRDAQGDEKSVAECNASGMSECDCGTCCR